MKVANAQADHVSVTCQESCVAALSDITAQGTVVIDDGNEVFDEYLANLNVVGQPGLGDQFLKWLWNNQGWKDLCHRVTVQRTEEPRLYLEFPEDPELEGFDRSDRIFVAVALASGLNPPILNASDSDWWIFGTALERNGIFVKNLCPDLIESEEH